MAVEPVAKPLTIAIPNGRLFEPLMDYFSTRGIRVEFGSRRLSALDKNGKLEFYRVKNSDLPTYVYHGITGLGVAGDDTIVESGHSFVRLSTLPMGKMSLCIAAPKGSPAVEEHGVSVVNVATSYVRLTRDWFHRRGIPVKIIKLGGSVELAPSLGLAQYITDLVETGETLRANNLEILGELAELKVRLIANPAYFKLHYREIGELTDIVMEERDD